MLFDFVTSYVMINLTTLGKVRSVAHIIQKDWFRDAQLWKG